MIHEKRILKIIIGPHVSEKVSSTIEKCNTIVLKVVKDATKAEIKAAVHKLFAVKVNFVHTLIVKGKKKRHGHHYGKRNNWKKAYVSLIKGQNINNLINKE